MGTMYMKFKTSLNAMVIISNARFARICAIARYVVSISYKSFHLQNIQKQ